jgi:uncharacterized membrane protein
MKQKELIAKLDQARIVEEIRLAELKSSGEIRVHIQPHVYKGDAQKTAERTFERLGMTKTEQRNGVLLFIACEEQQFAIVGDSGINDIVGHDFWEGIARQLGEAFRAGRFTDGIVEAVHTVGERLIDHFPRSGQDQNELADEISIWHDETH